MAVKTGNRIDALTEFMEDWIERNKQVFSQHHGFRRFYATNVNNSESYNGDQGDEDDGEKMRGLCALQREELSPNGVVSDLARGDS